VVTASPLVIPAGNTSGNMVVTVPAGQEETSNSKLNQCGLGSGLTVRLLMLVLIALRWSRD